MAASVCKHSWISTLDKLVTVGQPTACYWALSTSHAAVCGLSSEGSGKGVSSTGDVKSAGLTPSISYTCTRWLFQQMCWTRTPKSPQLMRAPLGPDVQVKCLNAASQVVKPVLHRDGWLEHGLWWYSWSIFLVLTKPCEIVAFCLSSFFLKWNAQWWCQWLIITFCDWEYRFHCKINANVNCSIFM